MNTPTVSISGTKLPYIEYNKTPVVTFAMIDAAHNRPSGTASRTYRKHREHFIESEDMYLIDSNGLDVLRRIYPGLFPAAMTRIMLFTETGYLMLVKTFTDDLAWQVQRQLVKSYFRVKGAMQPTSAPPVPEPIDHYQRQELFKTANQIFYGFGGARQGATGWFYNHVRTEYNLRRIEDLSQDDYPAVMDLLLAQRPKVAQYMEVRDRMRDTFLRDVIGHGDTWTAWLSKHIGGAHKIGQRPNWKAIAHEVLSHNGIIPTKH